MINWPASNPAIQHWTAATKEKQGINSASGLARAIGAAGTETWNCFIVSPGTVTPDVSLVSLPLQESSPRSLSWAVVSIAV